MTFKIIKCFFKKIAKLNYFARVPLFNEKIHQFFISSFNISKTKLIKFIQSFKLSFFIKNNNFVTNNNNNL